jgi:uncharacterized protein YqeY
MAETLMERMRADLNAARRSHDRFATLVLSTLLSDMSYQRIEAGHELTDAEAVQVVGRAIKRRREAAEQMRAGGRPELAEKEEKEAELLARYLPPQLGAEDVRAMVREIIAGGAASVGAVMGQLMPRIQGQFDGREANRIVREELGGGR